MYRDCTEPNSGIMKSTQNSFELQGYEFHKNNDSTMENMLIEYFNH